MTPITILTITFDRVLLLQECYESFKRLSYQNKIWLVVNDNPNNKWICEDNRVININLDKHFTSLSAKMNYAIKLIPTDHFIILEDDDLLLPGHVNHMLEYMEERSDYQIWKNKEGFYAVDNELKSYHSNVMNGCLVKKEGLQELDLNRVCSFDQDLFQKHKVYIGNKYRSHIYRWGMDTFHASGMGDGKEGQLSIERHQRNIINSSQEKENKLTGMFTPSTELLFQKCLKQVIV